ncbi:MAG: serine O-acetyltransferase [Myxococcota bacterium]|jgi:serine O-acetyltransferase
MTNKSAMAGGGPKVVASTRNAGGPSRDASTEQSAEFSIAGDGESPDDYSDVVTALTQCAEDALSEAACGGIVDPAEVVAWTEFARRLILYQRDEEILRVEVPELARGLERLLSEVQPPEVGGPQAVVREFMSRLVQVRNTLALDLEAAFNGDPASQGYTEIAVSYPSIQALAVYRIAHELHEIGVPTLPRIMSEYAHSTTGIDIHPGAKIGLYFFVDHGTGVVIGETCEIGDRVRLYQGVTLGAVSVRDGPSLRGRKRHPTVEDDVTIYAGSTILGGDTVIGKGSVIGGNVWITKSIKPGSHVIAEPPHQAVRGEDPAAAEQLKWDL